MGDIEELAKKENSISINIWDDYWDDGYIPEGEIQKTYAYVEGNAVNDEFCHTCLFKLMTYLSGLKELVEDDVSMELVFHDSAQTYPNLVGSEHEWCLYKRWELRFRHLTHARREFLIERLESANFEHGGRPFDIYSGS